MPNWHIETFKAHGPQSWRFRIVGENNETILPSEGYATRWNRNRIVRLISNALALPIVDEDEKEKI